MTTRLPPQCLACSHWISPFERDDANATREPEPTQICAAYPDEIPDDIWWNRADHREPQPGDHGIQWQADGEAEFPEYAMNIATEKHVGAVRLPKGAPRSAAIRAVVAAELEVLLRGDVDDDPIGELDGDTQALLQALSELDGGDDVERAAKFDPAKHPRGPDGKFLNLVDRIVAAVKDHKAGKGKGDPFDGFDREQLRKAAKARGIPLKRGEDRDSIAKKLLADLGGPKGGKVADWRDAVQTKTGHGFPPEKSPTLLHDKAQQAQVEADARDAIKSLAGEGEWVRLPAVRDALQAKGYSREEQDAALLGLATQPDVHIIPIANLKSLSADDRKAAVWLGGEHKTAIMIVGGSDKPKAKTPRATAKTGTAEIIAAQAHVRSIINARTVDPLRPTHSGSLSKAQAAEIHQVMDRQAELVPQTVQRLKGITLDPLNSGDSKMGQYQPAQGYGPPTQKRLQGLHIYLNVRFGQSETHPERHDELMNKFADMRESGFTGKSSTSSALGYTMGHEFGHHVMRMMGFTQTDPHGVDEFMSPTALRPVLVAMDTHLGTSFLADLDNNVFRAFGGRRAITNGYLNKVSARHGKELAKTVSGYAGSGKFHELMAEIWQTYSSLGDQAPPGIRAIGDTMCRQAEKAAKEFKP